MVDQNKKKKISKILLKISAIIGIILLCIITINYCAKTTKAEEIDVNYLNYDMLVKVENVTYSNDEYTGIITIIAKIENNTIIQVIDNISPDYEVTEETLLTGPYETYGATSIQADKFYFVYSEEGYNEETTQYTLLGASEINTFYNWFYGGMYTNGLNASQTEAYNQGKSDGAEENQIINDRTIETIKGQYDLIIDDKNAEINRLQEQLNSTNITWGSYQSLLGTIFLFPIQFFKEGFDVNIFGVNVGSFIVGIGILVIITTIIGFVLSGRIGRGGNND